MAVNVTVEEYGTKSEEALSYLESLQKESAKTKQVFFQSVPPPSRSEA
jgi:hypothetical protein